MNLLSGRFPLAIAAALALTACGGGSEATSTTADPPTTESAPEVTIAAADTAPAVAPDTVVDDSAGDASETGAAAEGGCDQVLTLNEIESTLGSSVEISGSSEVCQLVFASDSVGTFQAFSGSKADQAIDTLLPKFQSNETSVANGVVLGGDRGYVLDGTAVVRGDSDRVFVFTAPDNLEVADLQAAMQNIADLLLTR